MQYDMGPERRLEDPGRRVSDQDTPCREGMSVRIVSPTEDRIPEDGHDLFHRK